MLKRRPVWGNYKEKVAKKRMRKGEEKGATGPKGGLTVRHLLANMEGKCQKYLRIWPLTLVPCEKEMILENIKAVCKAHFNTELECDVLAGTRADFVLDQSAHLFTFFSQLIKMQETRNLHQGELENIAVLAKRVLQQKCKAEKI
jgi:hypothetical protein